MKVFGVLFLATVALLQVGRAEEESSENSSRETVQETTTTDENGNQITRRVIRSAPVVERISIQNPPTVTRFSSTSGSGPVWTSQSSSGPVIRGWSSGPNGLSGFSGSSSGLPGLSGSSGGLSGYGGPGGRLSGYGGYGLSSFGGNSFPSRMGGSTTSGGSTISGGSSLPGGSLGGYSFSLPGLSGAQGDGSPMQYQQRITTFPKTTTYYSSSNNECPCRRQSYSVQSY